MALYPGQFLGLPNASLEEADAVIAPLPFERTVSYGKGTARAPQAIVAASGQIEAFDEETLVDFARFPRLHTLPPLDGDRDVEDYLNLVRESMAGLRGKFPLVLGGEHTVTYGAVTGLIDDLSQLTVVQIDAHADLIDTLDGRQWSHGTVMRRLWDRGCRLVQIGIRSLSREEHELIQRGDRITTFFAHQFPERWGAAMRALRHLEGEVYLTFDIDGLDPSIVPSTGTPQPDGLDWKQAMQILQTITSNVQCRLIGADLVEFIPSPQPPGCDIIAAKLAVKILSFWAAARGSGNRA